MMVSVVSGVISETEPTSVVLPTPKPPAMTIFADVTRPGRCATSEPPKSTQHPLKQFCAHRLVFVVERGRLVHRDQSVGGHVRHDHAGDTQRELHARRD